MNASMKATATGVLTKSSITITSLTWSGTGAIGDVLLVQDNNGREIWQAVAQSAQYNLSFAFSNPEVVFGINVITLGSGKLVVNYV